MWKVYQGDVLEILRQLPDEFVQCVVTSPPYYGLRDYGVEGQIGLEKTPEEYVDKLVEVFREVRRVLRKDGTVWLNLGDTYCGTGDKGEYKDPKYKDGRNGQVVAVNKKLPNLKPKDLIGIPWRVAFALQADGWWLRSDIIWHKPNPMPESVTDRPTKAHEYIFLLSKNQRYFYDADAIREPHITDAPNKFRNRAKENYNNSYPGGLFSEGIRPEGHPFGRNKRTVWTVSTQPYKGAHFATFPPKLIEPCILAGTSPKACPKCGAPWERIIELGNIQSTGGGYIRHEGNFNKLSNGQNKTIMIQREHITIGWQPTCSCPDNDGSGKCIVLDPFAGSGTTLYVAELHERDSIGIELNPDYCKLIEERMANLPKTRQVSLF